MDKASIVILAVALIFSGIMIYEIYILYANADEVKCDSFGNCEFTTILRNSTITESKNCYENGKQVNCSASNVNTPPKIIIQFPKNVTYYDNGKYY